MHMHRTQTQAENAWHVPVRTRNGLRYTAAYVYVYCPQTWAGGYGPHRVPATLLRTRTGWRHALHAAHPAAAPESRHENA